MVTRRRFENDSLVMLQSPSDGLTDLLALCGGVGGIDTAMIERTAVAQVKHLKNRKDVGADLQPILDLEVRWYSSLISGHPDWQVYNGDLYLAEAWACWIVYSRKYLQGLVSNGVIDFLQGVGALCDLGCGLGHTTAALKELLPGTRIAGTNLPGSKQYEIASILAGRHGFVVTHDLHSIGQTDVVFASEYFEHILEPVVHLHDIVQSLKPKVIIAANSFGTRSTGHFNEYILHGEKVHSSQVGRLFNEELRRLGFTKSDIGVWNSRPSYWTRRG